MKVYIITNGISVLKVYRNKKKAEKYVEIHSKNPQQYIIEERKISIKI